MGRKTVCRLALCGILAFGCGTAVPSVAPSVPSAAPSVRGTPSTPAPPVVSPITSPLPLPTPTQTSTASPTEGTQSTPAPDARTLGWRSDLEALVPRMNALHPTLDHGTSLAELTDLVSLVSGRVPELTDEELMVHVLGIVAMVSREGCDGHLGAFVWGTGRYPVDSLPLRLWLFDDGVYIVDALPPYDQFVGTRIEMVENLGIDEVLAKLDPLVPRDNEQTVRLLMPRYLLIRQVLRGAGLITAEGPIKLKVADGEGGPVDVVVDPIPMAEYNAWAGRYGLHLPADPEILYLSRMDEDLWWEMLEDGTIFVQYNRVEFLTPAERADLRSAMTAPDGARVVVDVRHNVGGEVPALDPLVELFRDPAIDRPERLYLITGRNTLSAGSLFTARLMEYTDAILVGETGGGCPTFWGDIEPVVLPYSGIEVSVPTMLEVGISPTDPRLTMDVVLPAPLTIDDWNAGIDPALVAIRGHQP